MLRFLPWRGIICRGRQGVSVVPNLPSLSIDNREDCSDYEGDNTTQG